MGGDWGLEVVDFSPPDEVGCGLEAAVAEEVDESSLLLVSARGRDPAWLSSMVLCRGGMKIGRTERVLHRDAQRDTCLELRVATAHILKT